MIIPVLRQLCGVEDDDDDVRDKLSSCCFVFVLCVLRVKSSLK